MEKKINILKNRILLTALMLMTAVAVCIVVGLFLKKEEPVIQGQAEHTDYRVSSKVPGRILEIKVNEGQHVYRGDTLVLLDMPNMTAKQEQAEAAYDAARAVSQKVHNGSREEEIRKLHEQWLQAVSNKQLAEKTLRRVSKLHDEGVVADQRYDEATAKCDAATAAEHALKAQYDMAKNGARTEEQFSSAAQAERARGAVKEIKSLVAESVLLASEDGVVSEIFVERGELVGTGAPIMNVLTDDVYFTFNLREDQLPGIEDNKPVGIYLPALDKTIKARVSLIKNVGNFATWKATSSLDRLDLKIFEVQVRPTESASGVKEGMSVIMRNITTP